MKFNPKLCLFMVLAVWFTSCTQDDTDVNPPQESTSKYQTLSHQEVLDMFTFNNTLSFSAADTPQSSPFVIPDLNNIRLEELINTDAFVTVIPATTPYTNAYSRILLLRENETVISVVFTMFRDPNSISEGFTGDYLITDLEGHFINGFKVENDFMVARYVLQSNNTSNTQAQTLNNAHIVMSTDPECFGITCGLTNDEVIIVAPIQEPPVHVDPVELSNPGGNNNTNNTGESGNTGGGTNSNNGNDGDPAWDPVEIICPPGQYYDYAFETCLLICPPDFQNDGNNNCVRIDCDTEKEDLEATFPNGNDADLDKLAQVVNQYGAFFGINSKEKLQHFLAQAGHESGGFNNLGVTESLYYTTNSRLVSIFGRYFSETDTINKRKPDDYLRDSEKVANYVYANRLGNGNEASGDGFRYRGRGIFQLTGKSNYQAFQNFYNQSSIFGNTIDVVSNPNTLVTNKDLAVISALWFYEEEVLDKIDIDSNTSVEIVTEEVNGGTNGLADRENKFDDTKDHINCI